MVPPTIPESAEESIAILRKRDGAEMAETTLAVSTRVEVKGWRVWRNIRGMGITMDEAKDLVSQIEAMIPDADLNKFNLELTDRDQGNFEILAAQRRSHNTWA